MVQVELFDLGKFLSRVGKGRCIRKFKKGEVIFTQGDPSDAVFYVQSGEVKTTVLSNHGKEAVLSITGPDEFFGEASVIGQELRLATAAAMSPVSAMRFEATAIIRLIHDEIEFSEMFIAHILARTIRIEADLVDHLFNSSEKRLARVLLLMANFAKDDEDNKLKIENMSQETLAQMIGSTRARVSTFMNKFRKLGFIDYNGGITINKSLLNVVLLDNTNTDE